MIFLRQLLHPYTVHIFIIYFLVSQIQSKTCVRRFTPFSFFSSTQTSSGDSEFTKNGLCVVINSCFLLLSSTFLAISVAKLVFGKDIGQTYYVPTYARHLTPSYTFNIILIIPIPPELF